jgi:putative transposase
LRQAEEGTPVAEVCRKAGISEASFYNWRKKYGGLMPSEMKRLRQLERRTSGLKKLVADLALDKEMAAGRPRTSSPERGPDKPNGP